MYRPSILTVLPVNIETVRDTICEGELYDFNGNNLSTTGTYVDTVVGTNGCDSIVTLELIVHPILTFAFDVAAPAGSRVSDVMVSDGMGGFAPIDPSATYGLVSNNFVRNGGDGYAMFVSAANAYDFGPDLADVTAEYLAANAPAHAMFAKAGVQNWRSMAADDCAVVRSEKATVTTPLKVYAVFYLDPIPA